MASMFPQLFPTDPVEPSNGDAAVFAALRTQLDDEWYVFYGRELTVGGEQGRFDFVLLHREHGIAVLAVDVPDEEIDAALAVTVVGRFLDEQGFPALFATPPAIVALGVAPPLEAFREILLARFAAAPHTRPADPDWVEWLADRLIVAADLTSEPTIPLRVPDEAFVEEAQPGFRHVQRPSAETAVDAALAEERLAEENLPHPAAIAASDRILVRALGALTLFGALTGAVALAATGLSVPQSAVAPPSVVVAEPPPVAQLPAITEAAPPGEPKPEAATRVVERAPVHKAPRKRIAARRRHPEKSFWGRVAEVFR